MLRLPGLVRMPAGSLLRMPLTSLVQQTASVCSVCSALIQQARQQRQQLERPQHLHQHQQQQLLLPPARLLRQTTRVFLDKSVSSESPLPGKDSGSQEVHWTYSGENGVEHWADLFPACNGTSQSPVNINLSSAEKDTALTSFTFSNFDTTTGISWLLENNGHSAQVTYTDGDLHVRDGGLSSLYQVAQFHFHWGSADSLGSEHTVDGQVYPMEMHIVTYNSFYDDITTAVQNDDGLAVLGIFFKVDDNDNKNFTGLIKALKNIQQPGSSTELTPVDLQALMPVDKDSYCRYSGSLTTPPCNEVVTWTLFRDVVPISTSQLKAFRHLKSSSNRPLVNNFRPVQPLNGRKIKCNF